MAKPKAPRLRPEGCCPLRPVKPLTARVLARKVSAFKALSDPTRLEMFRLIAAQQGATCVCDIVDHFDLKQPTISHHLKVLKDSGLLRSSKVGIWAFYEAAEGAGALLQEAAEGLIGPA